MRRTLALCALFAIGSPLLAHARLARCAPAAGETVASAPSHVQLWFEGQVQIHYSKVTVAGPDKAAVQKGDLEALEDGESLRIALGPGLATGTYKVRYSVLSADGHMLEGSFEFTIGSAPK